MAKYELRFFFSLGGPCIWGKNEAAEERFGYPIEPMALPISKELMDELNEMEKEYGTYFDKEYPIGPSPRTQKEKDDFIRRANETYKDLKKELGSEYKVYNELTPFNN